MKQPNVNLKSSNPQCNAILKEPVIPATHLTSKKNLRLESNKNATPPPDKYTIQVQNKFTPLENLEPVWEVSKESHESEEWTNGKASIKKQCKTKGTLQKEPFFLQIVDKKK